MEPNFRYGRRRIKFVCKYCRGHWSMVYGVLTEPERDMLGKFAEDYGAFDY